MAQAVAAVIWWVSVWQTWHIAEERGRNRWAWTIAAMFAPLVTWLVIWLLPVPRRGVA